MAAFPATLAIFMASNWASALPSNTVWEDAYPVEQVVYSILPHGLL